jgi:hypothetical protein
MSEMDALFPVPTGQRNADDMGMPPAATPPAEDAELCAALITMGGRLRVEAAQMITKRSSELARAKAENMRLRNWINGGEQAAGKLQRSLNAVEAAIRCISVRGPDGDGIVWIVCTMPNGDAGAISVDDSFIAAKVFTAWREAAQKAINGAFC